jgi:hypothetical protein
MDSPEKKRLAQDAETTPTAFSDVLEKGLTLAVARMLQADRRFLPPHSEVRAPLGALGAPRLLRLQVSPPRFVF